MVAAAYPARHTGTGLWFNPWTVAAVALTAVFLAPIIAVFVAAAGDSDGLWPHLLDTVIPRYVANTVILMTGVGGVSLLFGVTAAWLVTRFEFPFCRTFEWLLLLPATVPAYLIAYTYTDFLEYAGPVQGLLRDLFGWKSARDYWFPEIRSMQGAMLVMGAVLYPYVYMMARTAFLLTPKSLFETGRLAGRSIFWGVGLPLARPAIAAGLALVLMETISDFGTVEYFAIETLTLGIFNVWLGMNNLTAAAQIASFAFLFIIALLVFELTARSSRRYADTSRKAVSLEAGKLRGWRAAACVAACATPVVLGFVVPVGVLLNFILRGYSLDLDESVVAAALNSVVLASVVAALVMGAAAFMVLASIHHGNVVLRRLTALASVGYAFPGTILAIGVVTAGGFIDDRIAAVMGTLFGLSHVGLMTGGIGLVVFACVVRFQAVGYGAITSGYERLSPNMMSASRTLGCGFGDSLRRVVLPLMRLSIVAGGLLVFVDVMKELPMTLLLRPFNYETLATYVYQFAKDELLEEAALPALVIVLTGIIPVVFMNAALRRLIRR
ncbi:MAG: iron ABC transporter permease [Rhodospirillales bacterium]